MSEPVKFPFKCSDWFPEDVKPVHVGAYLIEWTHGDTVISGSAWWSGQVWSHSRSIDKIMPAHEYKFGYGAEQRKRWRGWLKEG